MDDWPGKDWTFETLKHELGSFTVMCNDRAPARRTDVSDGSGAQRTHATSFKDFIEYIESRDCEDPEEVDLLGQTWSSTCVPFYANGMRVFSEPEFAETLARAFPAPYFTSQCDNTKLLIQMTLDAGLKAISRGNQNIPQLLNVDHSVSTSLNKMFCGPKGTITRLHFDCGDAHAWLGQIVGTKLFVFYPPSDSDKLYPIESTHSPIDPLNPDYEKYPLFRDASPRVVILRPGEVVLNPRRWWHFAVALTPSVTVMRNFYNSTTNPREIVSMVIGMVQKFATQGGGVVAHEPRRQGAGV
jgi:chloride channel 7